VELFHEGLAEANSEGQAVRRGKKETVQLWAGELGRGRLLGRGGWWMRGSVRREEKRGGWEVRYALAIGTGHKQSTAARQLFTAAPNHNTTPTSQPITRSSKSSTPHDDTCRSDSEVGGVGGGPDTISAARSTSAAGEGGVKTWCRCGRSSR
jgi:hypothetical protein